MKLDKDFARRSAEQIFSNTFLPKFLNMYQDIDASWLKALTPSLDTN